ncbi:unnamed protein product [Discosporangium mesarthrocarpum]
MARLLAGGGDFKGAASQCELAVDILKRRYTGGDIELGMERLKLAGLWFNAGELGNCLRECKHARATLSVCLGADDPQLEELDEMEHCCQEQLLVLGRLRV